MIAVAEDYKKTNVNSRDGIEAYLENRKVEKKLEEWDAASTHPLLRISYLLFHSSESYRMLQILYGSKGTKTMARTLFEEVNVHDVIKSGDSNGSLKFKAKRESEQLETIRDVLYNNHKSYQYGLNENLKGAWVLKSIDLSDPEKHSVSIYDIHNIRLQTDLEDDMESMKGATFVKDVNVEAVKNAVISDITSRIDNFKRTYEEAVNLGRLVIVYKIGGDCEYISAPNLQERIKEAYESFKKLNIAIELDRKAATEKLRIRILEKEAKRKREEEEKRRKIEIELESEFEYVELEPPAEEVEKVAKKEFEKVA